MIRFILKHRLGLSGGQELASMYTVDIDVPELERTLARGGYDLESGRFEVVELVGAEVRQQPDEAGRE